MLIGRSPRGKQSVGQAGPANQTVEVDHSSTLQARELELRQLRRVDPQTALAETSRWLSESRSGSESEAWAVRADAHIQRELGAYDRAVARYEQAAQLFTQLGADAESARTGLGQVWALRLLGRYDEALRLGLSTRRALLANGRDPEAAIQTMNIGTVYRAMGPPQRRLPGLRHAARESRRFDNLSDEAAREHQPPATPWLTWAVTTKPSGRNVSRGAAVRPTWPDRPDCPRQAQSRPAVSAAG